MDSNDPVTGVDKGQHRKEEKRKQVFKTLCREVRITGPIIRVSSVSLPQIRALLYTRGIFVQQVWPYTILHQES